MPIEVVPGEVRVLSEAEARRLDAEWIATFCKDAQGASIKKYRWHIFSHERYPAQSAAEARKRYAAACAPRFIVLANDGASAIETDVRPETVSLTDYLVFPPNLAWTMAFTHEDGWLGPYFATHPDHPRPNEANVEEIEREARKREEIAHAKAKGWM